MRWVFVILSLSIAVLGKQGTPPRASLEGVVVDSATGRPIPEAIITPFPVAAQLRTTSTADGRFLLTGLEPGTHNLQVAATGYRPTRSTFSVTSGEPLRGLTMRLDRYGVISGRIVRPDGQPAALAEVQLFEHRHCWGTQCWNGKGLPSQTSWGRSTFPGGNTTDKGDFRLFNVTPGEYYLVTIPPRTPQDTKPTFGAAVYPGVSDLSRATPIRVTPGADVRLGDIVLGLSPTGWVRGHAVDQGRPIAGPTRFTVYDPINGDPFNQSDIPSFLDQSGWALRPFVHGRYTICGEFSVLVERTRVQDATSCAIADFTGADLDLPFNVEPGARRP
jgi:hypothetical protein